jgi:ketosteroid isomerase-like protein
MVNPFRTMVSDFAQLLTTVGALEAMRRYYANEVVVFENREMARAGLAQCLAYETSALDAQPRVPTIQLKKLAADEATGVAFLETIVRFTSEAGRPMRLEQVAVQRWEAGKITEERFYYEGYIDEGDPEEEDLD